MLKDKDIGLPNCQIAKKFKKNLSQSSHGF